MVEVLRRLRVRLLELGGRGSGGGGSLRRILRGLVGLAEAPLVHDSHLRPVLSGIDVVVVVGHLVALTSIFFGRAFSVFGISTVSTPSENRASTALASTNGGNVTARLNSP